MTDLKKKIAVKFVDFWDNFVPEKSLFWRILTERYEIEPSDTPDYLFFSVFGEKHLQYDCIKIFYTGENQAPDFNLADYAIGFEYLSFGDRYMRLPNYYLYETDFRAMEGKTSFRHEDLESKAGFCSFVYSNGNSSPERWDMFDLLNSYKPVSSGGRYRNNIGGPVKDKLEFQQKHKFSIAFENCSHSGYSTEKIVQSFAAQTIPIYWGDPDICRTFNSDSFINASEYSSLDEVVSKVIAIDNDDSLYLQMMQTPALLYPESDGIDAKQKELSNFLCHIFNQNLISAQRVSRVYWSKRYLNRQRVKLNTYRYSVRGIMEAVYKKYLWKHSRKSIHSWKLDMIFKKIFSGNL